MIERVLTWCGVSVLVLGLTGCATMRDLFGRDPKPDKGAAAADVAVKSSASDHEARLRAVVEASIASADTDPDFVKSAPYFYQEYEVYPSGTSNYDLVLTEKDSRTVPYMGEVKLPKIRYATKLHRNRGDAREDTNFLRETGTETRSYELRYGDWVFVGSLFQVEKKEEQINGEWVPAQEEVAKAISEESGQGWLGRTWSWITGR